MPSTTQRLDTAEHGCPKCTLAWTGNMNFQIDVSSNLSKLPAERPAVAPGNPEVVDLLRQLLDVQRAAADLSARGGGGPRHDLALARLPQPLADRIPRPGRRLPEVHAAARARHRRMIVELTERLTGEDDPLDTDFALQDFLDRYGMRLCRARHHP